MPLTPLPANNTRRYFIIVTGPSFTHRIQVRVDATQDNATAVPNLQADMTVLAPAVGDNYAFTGLEVAEIGSDIRNPVAGWTVIPGGAVIPVTGQDIARSFSIRGRSSTGRKTRNLLWGLTLGHQPDFEYSPAPESDLGLFIAQVQGHVHSWLAIDETKPIFAGNLLEDYNDHYEHELRP